MQNKRENKTEKSTERKTEGKTERKIGFIGAGNMASAMIRAVTGKGVFRGSEVMVINKNNRERIETLQHECGVLAAKSLEEMASLCSTLVICTKPDQVTEVLDTLSPVLDEEHLLVSVVAGITIRYIQSRLVREVPVVRAMPNTPVEVGEGAIAVSAGEAVSPDQRAQVEEIFRSLGKVVWVSEGDMDVITALSGSGPAYFYKLALAMSRAAERLGLERNLARELSAQTLIGAGFLLKYNGADTEDLLRQVVSPKGTTAAALRVFESKRLDSIVEEAMTKAAARSVELSGLPERRMLTKSRKIVVKIGSSTITDENGNLKERHIKALVDQIAKLVAEGRQVLVVSSGAIACGRGRMRVNMPDSITGKQALAAIGQGLLMRTYECLFDAHGLTVAQILLTREDLASPKRSALCKNTLDELLLQKVVPIINENDTVAVDEIRLGDNDTLSARVAVLAQADLLVILTDTDGLYTMDPRREPNARRITRVRDINSDLLGMAQSSGGPLGTGGMLTKLWAASLALEHGIPTVIANGAEENVLVSILNGQEIGTFFSRDSFPPEVVPARPSC